MHIYGLQAFARRWKSLTNEAAICQHTIGNFVVIAAIGTRFRGGVYHWIGGGAGHGRRERADAEH